MDYDDLAWDRCDELFAAWRKKLFNEETFREIAIFVVEHRDGLGDELVYPRKGSFNLSFQMKFRDGGSAVIRFPIPGFSIFPEEKSGEVCQSCGSSNDILESGPLMFFTMERPTRVRRS